MIKILCTRNVSETLIQQSAQKGIDLEIKEFITVQPSIPEKDIPTIQSLIHKQGAVIVFTSKNAVRAIGDYFYKNNFRHILSHWSIYCISEVTLRTVEEYFPNAIIQGKAAYAADLVNILLQKEIKNEIYFFCGNKRRDTLPDALRNKGITVNEIMVYTTVLTPHHVTENYDGIVFFSPSAVDSFFSENTITPSTICFAIGNTTAASIRENVANKVVISRKQDATTMIQEVSDYFSNK